MEELYELMKRLDVETSTAYDSLMANMDRKNRTFNEKIDDLYKLGQLHGKMQVLNQMLDKFTEILQTEIKSYEN
jgi:hypothetical protein